MVRDHVAKHIPQKWSVAKEQRFGNLQPDLVLRDIESHKALIVDIKVCYDSADRFMSNQQEMSLKYEPLRVQLEQEGYASSVRTVQVGVAGTMPRQTLGSLQAITGNVRKTKWTALALCRLVLHNSRNIVVHHITGTPQK